MRLDQALPIANRIKAQLEPHCERIEIAGSIRREKPEVGDIEIVAIPKPYDVGLFESGIATVVNCWPKGKGELPCKYTQRIVEGVTLDLFFAVPENWGLIYAIRTGSAEYSHRVLAIGWVRKGYYSDGGMLFDRKGREAHIREELDLFGLIGIPWVEPRDRTGPLAGERADDVLREAGL